MQVEIFKEFTDLFNKSLIPELSHASFQLDLPSVKIDNSLDIPNTNQLEEGIFDRLGYFRSSQSDSIFLCPQKIQKSATSHKISNDLLTLIVYIHEVAHYFHFHSDKKFNSDFNKYSKVFVESFAQLLTHKIAVELDNKLNILQIFLDLTDRQPWEYKQYKHNINIEGIIGYDAYKNALIRRVVEVRCMCLYRIQDIFDVFIRKKIDHPADYSKILDELNDSSANLFLKENEFTPLIDMTGFFDQYNESEAFIKL